MRNRTAAGTVMGAIALAVLGALMGPQYAPVPMTDPLTVQASSPAIPGAEPTGPFAVESSVVTVELEGATVAPRSLFVRAETTEEIRARCVEQVIAPLREQYDELIHTPARI